MNSACSFLEARPGGWFPAARSDSVQALVHQGAAGDVDLGGGQRTAVVGGGEGGDPADVLQGGRKLRAVISNGDLEAYWTFHTDREQHRLHQTRHQDEYALTA